MAGTRVSLDSIVYAFLDGHTAESIQQSFPLLTLEQVYGAITYYLAHRETIEAYLREQEAAFETLKALYEGGSYGTIPAEVVAHGMLLLAWPLFPESRR